jgi:hypothetical protein
MWDCMLAQFFDPGFDIFAEVRKESMGTLVSQTWAFIFLSSTVIMQVENSTPIVDLLSALNIEYSLLRNEPREHCSYEKEEKK